MNNWQLLNCKDNLALSRKTKCAGNLCDFGLSLKNWQSSPGILFNAPFLELVCICRDADIFLDLNNVYRKVWWGWQEMILSHCQSEFAARHTREHDGFELPNFSTFIVSIMEVGHERWWKRIIIALIEWNLVFKAKSWFPIKVMVRVEFSGMVWSRQNMREDRWTWRPLWDALPPFHH